MIYAESVWGERASSRQGPSCFYEESEVKVSELSELWQQVEALQKV